MGIPYRKIGLTQRFNIEDTKQRSQIRVEEVQKLHTEKHFEGSKIVFLESGAICNSLQIFTAFFTIYGGSNIC